MKSTNNFPQIKETIALIGQEATYRNRKTTNCLINQLTMQLLHLLWDADEPTIRRTKRALGDQVTLRAGLPTQKIFKDLYAAVCILYPEPSPKYKD